LADRATNKANEKLDQGSEIPVIEYAPLEIYKTLLVEQQGKAPTDPESIEKREKMKRYLRETMNTD
jgi:hypothetical protein